MKRIVYAVLGTVAGLVLLFSYRTSLEAVPPTDAPGGTSGTAGTTSGQGARGSGGTSGSSSVSFKDGSYTGPSTDTRWGPVQVRITVSGGRITAADAIDYPMNNGRDQQINQYAIPQLQNETLQAQSAQIDMVSGATYTSQGYTTSLQSAIDRARS